MTDRLYYTDPTLMEFDAVIATVDQSASRWAVRLDRSAFYPTSGGQQSDRGTLGGATIVDVFEDDAGDVVHVAESSPGNPGNTVRGVIDRPRRQRHRQQHTAQHILSQVFIRLFSMETVSVHLGEEYGAIELSGDQLSPAQVEESEREATKIVFENQPVLIRFVSKDEAAQLPLRKIPGREGRIRLIQIGEFDYSACGGTHCLSTAEVGLIKITGVVRQRGNVLVSFLAGAQAIEDYRARFAITEQTSNDLTCHFGDIPGRLGKLTDELKETRLQLSAAQRELLPIRAAELAATAQETGSTNLVTVANQVTDPKVAAQLMAAVVEKTQGVAVTVVEGRLLVAASPESGKKAGELVKQICEKTGLRGGGSAAAAQIGGVEADRAEELVRLLRGLIEHA